MVKHVMSNISPQRSRPQASMFLYGVPTSPKIELPSIPSPTPIIRVNVDTVPARVTIRVRCPRSSVKEA